MLITRCTVIYKIAVLLAIVLTIVSCGAPGSATSSNSFEQEVEEKLKGVWLADIGELVGWGMVTERMEFIGKGSVTLQSGPANYIGRYELLDESRIRIDWEEQGVFGHSPSEIFVYEFRDENTLIFTKINSTKETVYLREAEYQRVFSATAEAVAIVRTSTAFAHQTATAIAPTATPTITPSPTITLTPTPLPGLQGIKERGTLIIGVSPGMAGFPSQGTEGFESDIARAIAERILGNSDAVEFRDMRGMSTEDLTLALNNRIIDIALVRTITKEPLESTVNLTLPYYVVSQRIIMKVGPDATIENLRNGWKIGTVGGVFEENVRKVFPSANVRGGIPLGEAYQALLSGAVDAYSGDGASLDLLVSQSPDLLVIVGESIAYIPAYGLISKDNQEFLNEVNAAIQAIKEDGTWKNIHLKWFPSDEEPILPPDS